MMKPNAPLDYAVFQLSPKRTRCDLFVSIDGNEEKIASGVVKHFAAHLKIVEEHVASASSVVKLEARRHKSSESWFTRGTLERFVRFVSTPEVLELVNIYDSEMSQLEAARRIYSQGGDGSTARTSDDGTKKELLRAIDVRLVALQQNLSYAFGRASAAGFNIYTVSELQIFSDKFGAHRLNEACSKFVSLCDRRPNLIGSRKFGQDDRLVRSSYGSDMSIDDDSPSLPHLECLQQPNPSVTTTFPSHCFSNRESNIERDDDDDDDDDAHKTHEKVQEKDNIDDAPIPGQEEPNQKSRDVRRLSVQDRINIFEKKQKENSGEKPATVKPIELRRLSSDVSVTGAEKAVLRRWSGASDMSIDLSAEKKDDESPLCTPSSALVSQEVSSNSNNTAVKTTSTVNSEIGIISSSNRIIESHSQVDRVKDRGSLLIENLPFQTRENGKFGMANERPDNTESFTPQNSMPMQESTEEFGISESVSGSRIREAFAARRKGLKGDFSSSHKGSFQDIEVVKTGLQTSDKASIGSISSSEDSIVMKKKLGGKCTVTKLSKKTEVQRDNGFLSANRGSTFHGQDTKEACEVSDSFSTPPPPTQQAQRAKQFRGNHELNDELRMKADELEKLFAEHKLQGPSEQSSSVHKGKPAISSLQYSTPVADGRLSVSNQLSGRTRSANNAANFRVEPPMMISDGKNSDRQFNKKFAELSVSDGSRGKLYDRYMQKRDAKLKADWVSNRAEKDLRLKYLQQNLEQSKLEMKAKFFQSAERRDSVSIARMRVERLRSHSSRSISRTEKLSLDFGDSGEDDRQASDHMEKTLLACEDSPMENSSLVNSASRAAHGKKYLPKTSTVISGKRRSHSENPLAQSVPNFSDMKKENTKPYGGIIITPKQARSSSRGKSTSDEAVVSKECISHQTDALQQSSANIRRNREIVGRSKLEDEETLENSGTKPFLRKDSCARFVPRSRQKISMEPEPVEDEVEEEQFEASNAELHEALNTIEATIRLHFGSENGDETSTFSPANQALGTQLPGEIRYSFLPMNSMQDWPLGSPLPWNGHAQQNPFSYTPDVDASVESPMKSPASWNYHPTMENDALARVRRKWGTSQKLMPLNSSPRKDKASGLKRLLKFGRKNYGSETLADWVSVTTSEGDDDNDTEDLRKSRMGFSHGRPSDDNFNGDEFISELTQSSSLSSSPAAPSVKFKSQDDHMSGNSTKASRSLFSFMSKGSESKAR